MADGRIDYNGGTSWAFTVPNGTPIGLRL